MMAIIARMLGGETGVSYSGGADPAPHLGDEFSAGSDTTSDAD
jgi:hypothetical protein